MEDEKWKMENGKSEVGGHKKTEVRGRRSGKAVAVAVAGKAKAGGQGN